MKQIRFTKILAASLACAASLGVAVAQTTTTTTSTDPVTGTTTTQQTTTSSAGNIVTYTPDSDYFMFRTASAAAPVRYYYTKDTTVVDPAGRVVSLSAIRPDMGVVANGGTFYQTRLVQQVQTFDNQIVTAYQVRAKRTLDMSPETLEQVRIGMIDVVNGGSGTAHQASIENVEVAGKTGTAQWGPKHKERTAACGED